MVPLVNKIQSVLGVQMFSPLVRENIWMPFFPEKRISTSKVSGSYTLFSKNKSNRFFHISVVCVRLLGRPDKGEEKGLEQSHEE